jgi:hypothetical protein
MFANLLADVLPAEVALSGLGYLLFVVCLLATLVIWFTSAHAKTHAEQFQELRERVALFGSRLLPGICWAVCGATAFLLVAGSMKVWAGPPSPFGGRSPVTLWQLVADDWSRPPLLHFLLDGGGDGRNFDPLAAIPPIGATVGVIGYFLLRLARNSPPG